MIVIDSSTIAAIFFGEPEAAQLAILIATETRCLVSAVNAFEITSVLRIRSGAAAVSAFWAFVDLHGIEIVPFDDIQAKGAAAAFNRYGKGIDPKAKLNICDCAAYALAKSMDCPLLFKGSDFVHTDIVSAVE